MSKHFELTILSTWEDEKSIPSGQFITIKSAKPAIAGFSSRNYQRKSTARGIEMARHAGCDYILKWRTDMLATQLDVEQLLAWSDYQPPKDAKSRLVMPAFRNISINPDYLSTIPDLFAFGHIDEMERLWGEEGFDYSHQYNVPPEFTKPLHELAQGDDLRDFYCAEAELYAIYQSRVRNQLGLDLRHKVLAEKRLRLIDYRKLGILWFGPKAGFRSIGQAWEHPWWTETNWMKQNATVHSYGRPIGGIKGRIRRKISKMKIKAELKLQNQLWLKNYSATVI
ncbi:WavE lipopolysaccharide synthesis family protein [Polynucleobacter brandtiae]|nr:WavE lipopolysaccharide synthesis family protein [Polynucleobacter brandtiae]